MDKSLVILLLFTFALLSCSEDEVNYSSQLQDHTVLVYMAADNNLYKNAKSDVDEMLISDLAAKNNLLVYLDTQELLDWYRDSKLLVRNKLSENPGSS
jgi:hypothetical protein